VETKDRQTDKQTDRQTDKQTNRQRDRQADRQTDRQTDKQTDRQTLWKYPPAVSFFLKLAFRLGSGQLTSPAQILLDVCNRCLPSSELVHNKSRRRKQKDGEQARHKVVINSV
jgi:polycomb protein EED